jgi:ankyrin repeat protein
MAPTDPARVLEIKNEILRRLVNEDIDARTGPDGQSVLAKYIQALDITPEIINFRAEGGTTALMYAAVNGRWKSIQILASPTLRTDPNIQNNAGETALMWAAAYNEISAVRELKKFRNDQNDPRRPIALNYNVVDNLGWNAMMVAAWCGHELIVQQLADYTDVNHVSADGRNAAKLTSDPVSPARIRGASNKVLAMLGKWRHPQQGGRNRTPRRSKTNSKKRGTR